MKNCSVNVAFIFLPLASRTQVEKKPNEKQSLLLVRSRFHFKDIANLLSEILTYFNIQPVEDTEKKIVDKHGAADFFQVEKRF